ncbi:MAG TPA: FAD-binding oxidoreductase [Povalibacter sp.]
MNVTVPSATLTWRATARQVESHQCNDTHSHLNPTQVLGRIVPRNADEVAVAIRRIAARGEFVSVCGARHAMGGQQFAHHGWLLDMRSMDAVLGLDRERGLMHVQAGILWPDLIRHYIVEQRHDRDAWGIRQKQTGADRLSIGGAVAANIHGRGLNLAPFVDDLEALEVVLADGSLVRCDRNARADLFRLVVGGYGLFGVVTSAWIRLVPRRKVQRIVELRRIEDIASAFRERIASGYLYGDFQFSTAAEDRDFLSRGVFSCYRPVDNDTPIRESQIRLSPADWRRLLYLAHRNKMRAFNEFADFYLQSSGQIYWSDTHQLSLYLDDYHERLDRTLQAPVIGSEMITELYVPLDRLTAFMSDVRRDFLRHGVNLIYGTIRLTERDNCTLLAWARERSACIIFNLHVDHDARGMAESASAFRRLIDIAIQHGGSYFLTYHRHATRPQVSACYPQFHEFLREKSRLDPRGVFQSDWYRHYRGEFEA